METAGYFILSIAFIVTGAFMVIKNRIDLFNKQTGIGAQMQTFGSYIALIVVGICILVFRVFK